MRSFSGSLRDELLNGEISLLARRGRIDRGHGGDTITPSGHTARWDIDHRRRRPFHRQWQYALRLSSHLRPALAMEAIMH